jgi:hypothetical protein
VIEFLAVLVDLSPIRFRTDGADYSAMAVDLDACLINLHHCE